MKKTLLFLLAVLISVASLLTGCQQRINFDDYRFTAHAIMSSEYTFPNTPVPIRVTVTGKQALSSALTVKLSEQSSCSGSLLHESKPLVLGNFIEHNFEQPLVLEFVPDKPGPQKLIFIIESPLAATKEEVELNFTVTQPIFFLDIADLPKNDSITVGLPQEMTISVKEDIEALKKLQQTKSPKVGGNTYTIRAAMKKGRGILVVADKTLINDAQRTKAEDDAVTIPKDEDVKMSFTSSTAGENVIDYTIEDSYSNKVGTTLKLSAGSPSWEMRNNFKSDTTYCPLQFHEFGLNIENKTPDVPNKFTLTVTYDNDISSRLYVENTFIANNSEVELKTGLTKFKFINPQTIEKSNIKLTITDLYGTERDLIVAATFKVGNIDYTLENLPSQMKAYLPYQFSGKLNVPPTTEDKYTVTYLSTSKKVHFWINDKEVASGQPNELTPGQQTYKITSDTSGVFSVKLAIADKFSTEPLIKVIPMNVDDNPINVTLSVPTKITYGNGQTLSLTLPTDLTHISSFIGTMSYAEGCSATIQVNGSNINENSSFQLKPGANTVKITPNIVRPSFNAELKIQASSGQIVEKPISFDIELPKLITTVEATTDQSDMTKELIYNVKIAEEFYTEGFEAQLVPIKGAGTIKMGSKTVGKDPFDIAKQGTYVLTILPMIAENFEGILRITDRNGQNSNVTIKGTVTPPGVKITDNLPDHNIKYNTPTRFVLTINQHLQDISYEKFTIANAATPAGTLTFNGNIYPWTDHIAGIKPGSYNVEFTPSTIGENKFIFELKDKFGKIYNPTLTFNVTPYELQTSLKEISGTSIPRGGKVTFKLAIAEEKLSPVDKFKCKFINTAGTGNFAFNETPIIAETNFDLSLGEYAMSFVPTSVGRNVISIEVTDRFGQTSIETITLDVTQNDLKMTATPAVDNIYIMHPIGITVNVDEANYTGRYHLKFNTTNTGSLKNSAGISLAANTNTAIIKGSNSFSYIPEAIGQHAVTITASDDFGQEKTVTLRLTGNYPQLVATPSASTVNATVNSACSFTVNITAAGYSGKFYASYTGGNGSLSIGGSPVAVGEKRQINSGNTAITFTPNATGSHGLKFHISDDYNQYQEFTTTVNAGHASMSFGSVFVASSGYAWRPVNVNITVSGLTPFIVKYTGGDGILRRNGNVVAQNSNVSISGNETWQYTPNGVGQHALHFTALDKNGQEKTATATMSASTASVNTSISSNNNTTIINTPTSTNLNLSSQAGDSPLKVEWSCPQGGTMNIVSGNKYAAGVLQMTYTPNGTSGTKNISIKVSDDFGQSATTTWTVNATYAEIYHSLNNEVVVYTEMPKPIPFSISKNQYGGSFTIVPSSNGGGAFNPGSMNVAAGNNHVVTFTPSSIGDKNLTFSVTDAQGGAKVFKYEIEVIYPSIVLHVSPDEFNSGLYHCTISSKNYSNPQFTYKIISKDTQGDKFEIMMLNKNGEKFDIKFNRNGIGGAPLEASCGIEITDKFRRKATEYVSCTL